MHNFFISAADLTTQNPVPIRLLPQDQLASYCETAEPYEARWIQASGLLETGKGCLLIPARDGGVAQVLAVYANANPWTLAELPAKIPAGYYRLEATRADLPESRLLSQWCLGWVLAQYQVPRPLSSKTEKTPEPRCLVLPEQGTKDQGVSADWLAAVAAGIKRGRDMINAPANLMTPAGIAKQAKQLADTFGADYHEIVGKELLAHNYPAVYTVGAAVDQDPERLPRLLDLRWGTEGPAITLVGKGVSFDTGGLDLKPAAAMALMKKDMGGSAYALALAEMLMQLGTKIRLRVLIPAVENAVGGAAFRPQDVIATRKGLSVEIGNTDAEGRLILADALYEATSDNPDLIFDFATLTGAARVALGTEVPALFSNRADLARRLQDLSGEMGDIVWHMPLIAEYESLITSQVADLNNSPSVGTGGAIAAALFLQHFVGDRLPWLHLDTMAWASQASPGRPKGGALMGVVAILTFLQDFIVQQNERSGHAD